MKKIPFNDKETNLLIDFGKLKKFAQDQQSSIELTTYTGDDESGWQLAGTINGVPFSGLLMIDGRDADWSEDSQVPPELEPGVGAAWDDLFVAMEAFARNHAGSIKVAHPIWSVEADQSGEVFAKVNPGEDLKPEVDILAELGYK